LEVNIKMMNLSKSQYIRGLQCHRSLWLYKNRLELRDKSNIQTDSLFKTGYQVGELAKQLFAGGVEIAFDSDDFGGMIAKTKSLITNGTEVIYEATFSENGIFVMVDILVKNGDKWDIFEVKGTTKIQNKNKLIKKKYLNDIAIQWYVLSCCLKLNRAYIVHIDNTYVRQGELSLESLFKKVDVTDAVLQQQEIIPNQLKSMQTMLISDEPNISIGKHCFDPYECDFMTYCWQHIPKENSVFDISYANGKQWRLLDMGIYSIDDIPDSFHLGANASLQIAYHKSQEVKIDKTKIKMFLDTIKYPINFFDFETFQEVVPRFNNQRPYKHIPFQYSLHILYEDGTFEHKEFLGDENKDPRESLIVNMLNDITSEGSIVAYNQSFEIKQIKNLANFMPSRDKELLDLIERFVDLAYPFQKKYYYHPKFKGKYSIKVVLPTLFPNDPELDYKKLGTVQNGGDAMEIFAKLHLLKDQTKREEIRDELLAYCHLDTLAMVRIWEKLHTMIED